MSERRPPSKLLAEWFWTDRWIGSSAFLLPIEARGLYREMLTQAWRRGAKLPKDHETIRRAVGCTPEEWARCWPLIEHYWRVDGNFIVNDTQVEVWATAMEKHQRAIDRARKGAEGRAQALAQARAQAAAQAEPGRSLEVCPPSPSPSPSPDLGTTPSAVLEDPGSTDNKRVPSGRAAEKPRRVSPAKPHPPKELLTHFDRRFRQRFDCPAPIDGSKDAPLMSKLLRKYDQGKVTGLIDSFFESSDPFIQKSGYTVGAFYSQVGKLLTAGAGKVAGRGSSLSGWASGASKGGAK